MGNERKMVAEGPLGEIIEAEHLENMRIFDFGVVGLDVARKSLDYLGDVDGIKRRPLERAYERRYWFRKNIF
jgi:hypothetical protein